MLQFFGPAMSNLATTATGLASDAFIVDQQKPASRLPIHTDPRFPGAVCPDSSNWKDWLMVHDASYVRMQRNLGIWKGAFFSDLSFLRLSQVVTDNELNSVGCGSKFGTQSDHGETTCQCRIIFLEIPAISCRFSIHFPMECPSIFHDFPWFSYDFPMFSIHFPGFPIHFPNDFPRTIHRCICRSGSRCASIIWDAFCCSSCLDAQSRSRLSRLLCRLLFLKDRNADIARSYYKYINININIYINKYIYIYVYIMLYIYVCVFMFIYSITIQSRDAGAAQVPLRNVGSCDAHQSICSCLGAELCWRVSWWHRPACDLSISGFAKK